MKKSLFIFVILPIFIFLPTIVFAAASETAGGAIDKITNVLTKVLVEVKLIGYACAGIGFGIAAILFLTAGGNPSQIETAKKALIWAIIGLMVIFFSMGLVKIKDPGQIGDIFK